MSYLPECYTCGSKEASIVWVEVIQSEQCTSCINKVYIERDILKARITKFINGEGGSDES